MSITGHLILVRHGQTEWNLTNRFTGWTDVLLDDVGLRTAENVGRILRSYGFHFDEAHISALRRTKQTLDCVLFGANQKAVPTYSHWRLNERHYGQLQGMYKEDIYRRWGDVALGWWRGYFERPPALEPSDPRHPGNNPEYQFIDARDIPNGESLHDCLQRVMPYWESALIPSLMRGRCVLLISHGNTLRALIKILDELDEFQIQKVEVYATVPLVYRFSRSVPTGERYVFMP